MEVRALRRRHSFNLRKPRLPSGWARQLDHAGEKIYVNAHTTQTTKLRPPPLQKHWKAAYDDEADKPYWWNTKTKDVVWEPPLLTAEQVQKSTSHTTKREPQTNWTSSAPPPMPPPPPAPNHKPARAKKPLRALGDAHVKKLPGKTADNNAATASDGGGISMSTGVFSWDKRKERLDVRNFTFSKRSGETLIKLPGSIGGEQFIIEECEDCQIYLLDWSASVSVDACRRCSIFIGPCESSIFLRDCDEMKVIGACKQFRTRGCNSLDALLLSVSQPSIETTTGARFGCFMYFYPELEGQLVRAQLSPLNNRWYEGYNFTPSVGQILCLPPCYPPEKLVTPLSIACPQLGVNANEEERVGVLCPIPQMMGTLVADNCTERAFLLVFPRCAQYAVRWARQLLVPVAGNKIALLRAREFNDASADLCSKICSRAASRAERIAMIDAASRGRLVGMELAALSGSCSELCKRVAGWNEELSEGGPRIAYVTTVAEEVEQISSEFFAQEDIGTALQGDER